MFLMLLMKIGIWIIFYISIAGMFLSAALRSAKFREIIVNAWISTTIRLEKLPADFSITIFGKLLNIFYCKSNNKLSIKKILTISFITNVAWHLFTISTLGNEFQIFKEFDLKIQAIFHFFLIFLFTPQFLFFEYIQARYLVNIFNKIMNQNIYIIFSIFLLFIISFYASSYFILIFVRDIAEAGDKKMYVGIFYPIMFPALFVELWRNTAMISISKLFFMLPFILTFLNGLILIFFALVISNSKFVLKVLTKLIEKISASTYNQIFNYSMFLFTISTGFMQVYTF